MPPHRAINFWCSPEDKPADPDWKQVEIRKFALNYLRSYVGAVYGKYLGAEGETDPPKPGRPEAEELLSGAPSASKVFCRAPPPLLN